MASYQVLSNLIVERRVLEEREWLRHIMADLRVRIRIEGMLYSARLEAVARGMYGGTFLALVFLIAAPAGCEKTGEQTLACITIGAETSPNHVLGPDQIRREQHFIGHRRDRYFSHG